MILIVEIAVIMFIVIVAVVIMFYRKQHKCTTVEKGDDNQGVANYGMDLLGLIRSNQIRIL